MRPSSLRIRCRKAVSEISTPGSSQSSSSAYDPLRSSGPTGHPSLPASKRLFGKTRMNHRGFVVRSWQYLPIWVSRSTNMHVFARRTRWQRIVEACCLTTSTKESTPRSSGGARMGMSFYSSYYSVVTKGKWCAVCSNRVLDPERRLIEAREIAYTHGGKLLSTDYVNSHERLRWLPRATGLASGESVSSL
jgi:hypothetical protein